MRPYKPYVPQTPGELWDLLGSMMLDCPTFIDDSGYFPGMSIDTEFFKLTESFALLRKKFGEDRYAKLMDLAARTKAHFAADPEDKTEDSMAGRRLLLEMEDIVNELRRRKPRGEG